MAKHKHKFTARPCDDNGKVNLDRSRDIKGSYTSYRRFIRFRFNKKGEQGQAYQVFEHCPAPCGDLLVRRVMTVPR